MKLKYAREDLEAEYIVNEAKRLCALYGYRFSFRFGEIHIRTLYEEWKFTPTYPYIRLMHRPLMSEMRKIPDEYHEQFHCIISMQDLFRYIASHEAYKLRGKRCKSSGQVAKKKTNRPLRAVKVEQPKTPICVHVCKNNERID